MPRVSDSHPTSDYLKCSSNTVAKRVVWSSNEVKYLSWKLSKDGD
jgi:hypothetical protein